MSRDQRSELLVCSKACGECLFSPNKIVSEARKTQVLEECERTDTPFICHKHSIRGMRLKGAEKSRANRVVCRGYFERYRGARLLFRLADAMGLVRYVDEAGNEVAPATSNIGSGAMEL